MRYRLTVPIKRASGRQIFLTDAENEQQVLERFHAGELELHNEELEVDELDENGITVERF